MLKRALAGLALLGAMTTSAFALDTRPYAGTWVGKLSSGDTIQLVIPQGIEKGQKVSYWYAGKKQAPQTPVLMQDRVRLNNPGSSYIVIGPVKGNQLPYFWTNGKNQTQVVMVRAK